MTVEDEVIGDLQLLERNIQQKEELLVEKEEQLVEKEEQLVEKEEQLVEKDKTITHAVELLADKLNITREAAEKMLNDK